MQSAHKAAGLAIFCALGVSTALAAVNVKGTPAVDFQGDEVEVTVCFSGLGNTNGTVEYELTGSADLECTNRGGQYVEAQDTPISLSGEVDFTRGDFDRNGNVCVTISDEVEGCPNGNWRVEIADVDLTSLVVTVEQGGDIVFGPEDVL